MWVYRKREKNQDNLCNQINEWYFVSNMYFLILYDKMLKLVKNKLQKKDYLKLLDLLTWYVNKYNIIDFDKYKKENNMSKTTFTDFRASLSRNAIIKKTTTKLHWFKRYACPLLIRRWSSNHTELIADFVDPLKDIYWIAVENFID